MKEVSYFFSNDRFSICITTTTSRVGPPFYKLLRVLWRPFENALWDLMTKFFLLNVNVVRDLGALSLVEIYLLVSLLSVIDNLHVMINVNVVVSDAFHI